MGHETTRPAPVGHSLEPRPHTSTLRAHAVLTLIFVSSRAALHLAGLHFNFSLDWMWLSDPADLRDRLIETVYYFHAFPPGMDLLTGILLKLGGSHAATLAHGLFLILGLVFVNALFYLGRVAGLPLRVAMGVALVFTLIPQSIYFENLYLYEWPIATLLCLAAVLFHRAMRSESFNTWLAFFLVCAAIGLTRSTFHLVWFAAMIGFGVWFTDRPARLRVLAAAAVPAALLLSLYIKNLAVVGAFATSTFGPASYDLVTVDHLPTEIRNAWIRDGKLSPFAAVSVYAAPREYLRYFKGSERKGWPPQLNRLEHPSVQAANYNHWFLLEVHRQRAADALYYVQQRPLDYAANVIDGLKDMFEPSTEWHPFDRTERSPHAQHRQVLGRYEGFYNRVVHRAVFAPLGAYVLLPFVLIWGGLHARSLVRGDDVNARACGSLLYFCLFQILFVIAASSMFTFRESARYRFQIESMIWLMTALVLVSLWRSRSGRATAR